MKRILTTLCITFVSSLVAFAGIENGHEYVDLGLPSGTLWATCNIGADTPENHGYYFAWGEIEPKRSCEVCYKWVEDDYTWPFGINKYTIPDGNYDGIWYNQGNFIGDNKYTLEPEDDAAHVNWGGAWRMPTFNELSELSICTWIDTTQNGVNGELVVGPNGNSIFLPTTGTMYGENANEVESCLYYWSSSLFEHNSSAMLLQTCGSKASVTVMDRICGNAIRAVLTPNCNLASGTCGAAGDNLTWELSRDSVLTITGTGKMTSATWKKYSSSIRHIVLGSHIQNLCDSAFYGDYSNVLSVTSHAVTPPSGSPYCLGGISWETVIFIPETSMQEYASAPYWNRLTVSWPIEQCTVFSVCGSCGSDISWLLDLNSGKLDITGIGEMCEFGSMNEGFGNTPDEWRMFTKYIKHVTISEGITSVGAGAFMYLPALETVTLPSTITRIGSLALCWNPNLQNVSLPQGVRWIEQQAFEGNTSFTSIIIPSSVDSIAGSAFSGCTNVSDIVLPDDVRYIGDGVFRFDKLAGPVYNRHTFAYLPEDWMEEYTIPEGITKLAGGALMGCLYLPKVNLPKTLKHIAVGALMDCQSIQEIIIPDSVSLIESDAFWHCTNLHSVTMLSKKPATITTYSFENINYHPYEGSSYAEDFSFYVPCTAIQNYLSDEQWSVFTNIQPIPETCTSEPECPEFCVCGKCGDDAYWRVDSVAGLLEITGTGAMYDYGSLNPLPWRDHGDYIRTARVHEGITHLSGNFMGKSNGNAGLANASLDSVFLPSTLQTMGSQPFYCASNLKYIQCDAVTPPTGYVMKGENSNAELRVPCGSKKAYSQASGWKNYKNIVDGSYYFESDTVICGSSRDFEWLGYPILYYPREYTYHYADTIREEWRTYEMDSTVTIINTSVNGCDSIHTLNVHYASYFYYIETIEINSGESYRGYTQSGTYYERTQNRFGCDSIVYEIRLTVVPSVPSTHTITVNTSNTRYGSVSGGGTYNYGDTIMITAEPKQGYNFTGWNDGSTDNPRYVIVTGDSTFTAQFAVRYCEFVVEPNDFTMGAIVNIDSYQEIYRFGTQLTVEASPNSGYKFVKWNTGKNFNPYTITLTDDLYLLAIFAEEDEVVDTTTVKPGNNNATFEWPFIEGGFSYSLTIYLDIACTMPFVTIKFDASGRFVGLVFPQKAPRRAKTSEQADGFTYTIEGLDTNTEYFYKMQTYDANDLLINTDEGSFVTKDVASSIEETTVNKYVNTVTKFLLDGQLLILRDGNAPATYNMQGAIVK